MTWEAAVGVLMVAASVVVLGLSVRIAFQRRRQSEEIALALLETATVARGRMQIAMFWVRDGDGWDDEKRDVAKRVAASLGPTQVLLCLTDAEPEAENRFFELYIRAGVEDYSDEARDGLVEALKDGTPVSVVNDYLSAAGSLPLAFVSLRDGVALEFVEAVSRG